MAKETKPPIGSEPKWTWDDLLWYQSEVDFDRSHWWVRDRLGGGGEHEDHPELFARKRKNQSRQYRPGPIYWEVLRRHPDIPKLREGLWKLLENIAAEAEPSSEPVVLSPESLALASNFFRRIPPALAELACSYEKTWIELSDAGRLRFSRTFHILYNEEPFTTNKLVIRGSDICHDLLGGPDCPEEIDFSRWKSTDWRAHLLKKNGQEARPPWLPENFPITTAGIALAELSRAAEGLGLRVALIAFDPSRGKEELMQGLATRLDLKPKKNGQNQNRVSKVKLDSVVQLDEQATGAPRGDTLKSARKLFSGLRLFGPAVEEFYLDFDSDDDFHALMEHFRISSVDPNLPLQDMSSPTSFQLRAGCCCAKCRVGAGTKVDGDGTKPDITGSKPE